MDKIPFSVYDFFGHLAPGFVLLAAIDYSFDGQWFLKPTTGVVYGALWTIVAYILGHIIANVAGFLVERKFVHGCLQSPEQILLGAPQHNLWTKLFPGYYEPLPTGIRDHGSLATSGNCAHGAVFRRCRAIILEDRAVAERLNTFLGLYGFCRNMCITLGVAAILLAIGARHGAENRYKLWWALAATIGSVGMLYRYLKFFRKYTSEVFTSYLAINWRSHGANNL